MRKRFARHFNAIRDNRLPLRDAGCTDGRGLVPARKVNRARPHRFARVYAGNCCGASQNREVAAVGIICGGRRQK